MTLPADPPPKRDSLATRAMLTWPDRWAATYELPGPKGKQARRKLAMKLAAFEAWGVTPKGEGDGTNSKP